MDLDGFKLLCISGWKVMVPEEIQEVGIEEAETACYFPLANGRYEVKPGLMPFGTDLGNGQADQQVFQIDSLFSQYRNSKLIARRERLEKYYQTCDYSDDVSAAIVRLLLDRFTQEHPQFFDLNSSERQHFLNCKLTGEMLSLDANLQLQQIQSSSAIPPYASALDALACQIQEDLAVICRSKDRNWMSALHLCFPSHWAAEEKIGRDFATIHAPVAHMEPMNQRSSAIVHTMITRKPQVRFAWGLSADTRLNHHPEPPPQIPETTWNSTFDPNHPRLYLRIERQVIWGLPEVDAALFTIRTYFRDCRTLQQTPELCEKLSAAIASMSPQSLAYKGLSESQPKILEWLAVSQELKAKS
jgi:dimethylamine monooxygenase subunit A